ncbi:MAG: glycosyltransferase family 2 protein [Blastocatellia bacterium]
MSEQHRTQPILSVVIGSQNARASIHECLASLESQRNGREIEVVVVDNSTDGTTEIVSSQFPRLKLIKSPPTALMPELWETGIRESAGQIVAITTSQSW